jgi:predicted ester cyclase
MGVVSRNKQAVIRFNKDVIERGNREAFNELMAQDFVNRTAPPSANDAEAMWNTFNNVLRPAFANLKVEILDQIAENDKVTTRKAITGTHTGMLMGVAPTNRAVRIDVIDIVRLDNGKYKEHWGINNLQSIVEELRKASTGQTK